jgi:hypothetical protein
VHRRACDFPTALNAGTELHRGVSGVSAKFC